MKTINIIVDYILNFFGKKAFIANPGGSKEQTIDAIKKSLIEQKDLLDEILNSNEQNIYY